MDLTKENLLEFGVQEVSKKIVNRTMQQQTNPFQTIVSTNRH